MITDALTLWGDSDTYSPEQRLARKRYIDGVLQGGIEPPHLEWLSDQGDGVSGDALSRIATSIYNAVVEAREQERAVSCPCGGFADVLRCGLDAELWTLIRIGLEEAERGDFVEVCERWGYEVQTTSVTERDTLIPPRAH